MSDIPGLQHPKFAFIDSKSAVVDSLEALPDLVDVNAVCEHVIEHIDRPIFHTVHILYDFVDVDAVRTAVKAAASFVFVGAIPEVYREVLAGQTVRVATAFEDVPELVSGLLESLWHSFCAAFVKENGWSGEAASSATHPIGHIGHIGHINKYADRVWQSGKDFMRIVQTATGPLPLSSPFASPFAFRRPSQAGGSEEEVARKQGQSGLFYLLLLNAQPDEHCRALLRRLEASKVDKGQYSEFRLSCQLAAGEEVLKIAVPSEHRAAVRIVAIAARHRVADRLDWRRLFQLHTQLKVACRLAIAVCQGMELADRHFVALRGVLLQGDSVGWTRPVPSFDLPLSISIVPNELVRIQIDSPQVRQVTCDDPAISIMASHRVDGGLMLSVETHVQSSREVVFQLHTGHIVPVPWRCLFDVAIANSSSRVKRFQVAPTRHLIHLAIPHAVDVIECVLRRDHRTSLRPAHSETEWLIHTDTSDLCTVKATWGGGARTLFWSRQFLPKEIIK